VQIVPRPQESLFFKPFKRFPDRIGQEDRNRLSAEAKQVITEHVIPSYRKLHRFFTTEYLPACCDRVGAWQMSDGKPMCAVRTRRFTTTDMTPQQIHELGLREVRRIRGQMEEIIKQVEFRGSFEEFLQFLRTDSRFYYDEPQQLLQAYRANCKRIDPTLVALFGTLPRIPYSVEPIPVHIAPDTTTAYDRRLPSRHVFREPVPARDAPKYEMEAISIHEAAPRHHLQIALAMELNELPQFRRYGGYTAFVEGWGL